MNKNSINNTTPYCRHDNARLTKYPHLFSNIYWTNSVIQDDMRPFARNRNKMVKQFDIVEEGRNKSKSIWWLYDNDENQFRFDHPEYYTCGNGDTLLVFSHYRGNNDPIPSCAVVIPPIYGPRATSYAIRIPKGFKMPRPRKWGGRARFDLWLAKNPQYQWLMK